jgi:hypothetical protein
LYLYLRSMGWGVCPKLKNEFDLLAAIGEEL